MTTVSTWPKLEVGGGSSKPTIVFLAGFPDNQESPWGPHLRASICQDYHTVFLCLPGFETNGVPRSWGYNFDELLNMLHATIELSTRRDEQIYLVGHDWGAILALKYQNKYPNKIKKLALIDVGMLTLKTAALSQIAFLMLYQVWYALCYLVSQLFSKKLAEMLVMLFSLRIFDSLFVGVEEGKKRMREDNNVVLRCYVYFYLWRSILTGTLKDPKMPTCPILFLYGENKGFMFHSQKFIDKLSARPDCKYRGLPCGHWVGVQQENIVLEELKSFCTDQ
jgi:pimeloyl-ACP methyl ester carboxylesterase